MVWFLLAGSLGVPRICHRKGGATDQSAEPRLHWACCQCRPHPTLKGHSGPELSQHSDGRGRQQGHSPLRLRATLRKSGGGTCLTVNFSPSMGSLWLVLTLLQSHRGLCGLRTVLPYPGAPCETVTSGEAGAPIPVLFLEQAPTETNALWLSP